MRILFYTDSDFFSGAEKVLLEVANGVVADAKLTILNPRIRSSIAQAGADNRLDNVEYTADRSKLAFWQFFRFIRVIRHFNPTVCVVNMQTPFANTWFLLAAKCCGKRVVSVWHFAQTKDELRGLLRPLKLFAYHLAVYLSDTIVTVSTWHRDVLVGQFNAGENKMAVIANGLPDLYGDIKRTYSQPPLKFITIGTLEDRKNQIWLVKTLAKLSGDWQISLLSNGLDKPAIEQLIVDNNMRDRVILHGYQKDVPKFLRSHDVLLHPAKSENLSLVIIEALSSSMPVIANNVGGNSELVVNQENGQLLSCDDEKVWLSVLDNILTNPRILEGYSHNSRLRYLKHFTRTAMIDRYQQLLENK